MRGLVTDHLNHTLRCIQWIKNKALFAIARICALIIHLTILVTSYILDADWTRRSWIRNPTSICLTTTGIIIGKVNLGCSITSSVLNTNSCSVERVYNVTSVKITLASIGGTYVNLRNNIACCVQNTKICILRIDNIPCVGVAAASVCFLIVDLCDAVTSDFINTVLIVLGIYNKSSPGITLA